MKILYDYTSAQISAGRGIGRYADDLCKALVKYGGENDITLLINKSYAPPCDELLAKLKKISLGEEISDSANYDFLFITNFFFLTYPDWQTLTSLLPFKALAGIVYDLIPLIFPDKYLKTQDIFNNYEQNMQSACLARHLFAISECSKLDFSRISGYPERDISVIYGGVNDRFAKSENTDKTGCDIAFIAGNDPRKNYCRASKGFCIAQKEGKIPDNVKLRIICAKDENFDLQIKQAIQDFDEKIQKNVLTTGFIPDSEMIEHLRNAKFTVFASEYEGLGLPILESYALGTACIGSNTSSMRELLPENCQFSPYDEKEMADKIAEAWHGEDLRRKSILFGARLLKKINWRNAASMVWEKLAEIREHDAGKTAKKVAFFSAWPPSSSGVAVYGKNTVKEYPRLFDVFTDVEIINGSDGNLKAEAANKIYPWQSYQLIRMYEKYKNMIYVFGASTHNIFVLRSAIKNREINSSSWAYVHDADLLDLWQLWCDINNISIKKFYDSFYSNSQKSRYGLLPLAKATGISKFIVNNQIAKKMVLADLNNSENFEVKTLFHPIKKANPFKFNLAPGSKVIGSFGIPDSNKGTDKIIEAVKIINQKDNYFLLLAGYGAYNYLKTYNISEEFIIVHDSPCDAELLNLMSSVDLAVQLRQVNLGQSSGCVAQLLAMEKKTIVSDSIAISWLDENAFTVREGITPFELAEKIRCVIELPVAMVPEYKFEKYSYKALAKILYNLV